MRTHLNIDSELVSVPYAATYEVKESGAWDMSQQAVLGLMGDPSGAAHVFSSGNPANWSGYSNPDYDRMIEEIDSELDPAKRREKVQEMERLLLTDLPSLPGLFGVGYWCNYPYVKNHRSTWNPYGPNAKFEDVWMVK